MQFQQRLEKGESVCDEAIQAKDVPGSGETASAKALRWDPGAEAACGWSEVGREGEGKGVRVARGANGRSHVPLWAMGSTWAVSLCEIRAMGGF